MTRGLAVIAVSQSPEHSEGEAWQSPVLVIGILGFDIVWDLRLGVQDFRSFFR
jgi:hypothetical protein